MAYETFDVDLREGKAREDALAYVMLRARVEHKRDRKAARTGNHAIETKQKCSDGVIRPSGISITTADWWAVEYAPDHRLLVPVETAQKLADRAVSEGRSGWIGDGDNHFNALVPLEWFLHVETAQA